MARSLMTTKVIHPMLVNGGCAASEATDRRSKGEVDIAIWPAGGAHQV
mgnify:CR=1 FL=1